MMKRQKQQNRKKTQAKEEKAGFTLIEVMLVLGITGMMLLGLIGGTFSSIARQRYQDSLRSFAEYLNSVYSEVYAPESLGGASSSLESIGNSSSQAILGKVLVFGYDYGNERDNRSVYSATLVGNANPSAQSSHDGFIKELASYTHDDVSGTDAKLYCGDSEHSSTVSEYTPLWEANLVRAKQNPAVQFKGTIIIARTPTSGTIHTIFSPEKVYDLKNRCSPDDGDGAAVNFRNDLNEISDNASANTYTITQPIQICVKSEDSSIIREVRIAADGRNSSAISVLSEGDSECQ